MFRTFQEFVKYLSQSIFKNLVKTSSKGKGITEISPALKFKAEKMAENAAEVLQKNNRISFQSLTKSDVNDLADNIVNPIKNAEQVPVKSADILPFRFKRSFAEELADASKKGDFNRMTGIMKVDPKFKEVMESLKASKAADAAKAKMIGPKKLIPDRDVIPYQSPEVQKLDFADKLKRAGLTEKEYMDNIVKRGYGVDDAIYARDFYGDTTEDIIRKANTSGEPVAFAGGGVAGLLGERTGFRGGGMDMGNKSNQAQSASMGGGGGGGNARENYRTQQYTTPKTTPRGGEGGTTTPKPKPKVNVKKNISTGSFTPTFNFLKKFVAHDRFTDQLKARRSKNYHELGGLDFMARFPDINPSIAKGLASAYQNIFEYGRAVADGPGGITFEDADKRAKEESRLNAVGIDAFANPDSSLYQEYTDMVPESGAVQMADGGPARQNFAMGKRAFLKLLAGTGAGIAGLKSGLLGLGGKQATKKAVTETVKQTAGPGTPPPYFFKLVEKIKTLGDDVGATQDRQIAKSMKSKDGKSEYFLEEDVTTGDTIIKKISKEDDRLVSKVEIMQHNKGKADELTKGKKPKDTYEEVTEYNSRIYKDNYSPSSYEDGINQEGISEIVEEAGVGFVKKADGGRIGYNIGGLSKLGKIMAGINKKFGKNTMTTADKIVQPEKTIQQRIMEFEARNPKLSEIDKDILIRAKELKLEDNMPYVKNLYRVHRKDKAGIGSLKEFHADFVKETGQNVPIENLRTAWRSKRSYPFNTPVVDKTGKSIGGEATQKMYPESKKFIVEESAESFMKPKIKKTTEREFIDVPPMPKGFKLSREKLEKNYPELDEDMIDQIMELDKEMQGTVLTMLKNRRKNPDAYDKLLETKGDTLEFQGAFDEVTRKSNNADGGRIGLSTGGLARMLGE